RLLIDSATQIAIDIGHSVYDCIYLALAIEAASQFITADEAFVQKLRRGPLRDRAIMLSEHNFS
ncbi:MAG TPA: type II toxin-antitoxin system VapC family toxin, partial [Chthoniobacterales bacterium]